MICSDDEEELSMEIMKSNTSGPSITKVEGTS